MVVLCVGVAREVAIYLSTDCKRYHVIFKKASNFSKPYGGVLSSPSSGTWCGGP